MDDLLIKTNTVKNAATSGPNGRDSASALAGLAGPFQNLLHRAGVRIEDGFSILAARTGLGALAERADHVQPDDDYGRQQSDDAREKEGIRQVAKIYNAGDGPEDYLILSEVAYAQALYLSDRIWTRETGQRTPFLALGDFPGEDSSDSDSDFDADSFLN